MSVNKYKPHIWVLPEDDANREMANGFLLHPKLDPTSIDVRPVAKGWRKAMSRVENESANLRQYPYRHLVMLVDLDEQGPERDLHIRTAFPEDVRDRIYLLSTRDEPEALKAAIALSFEKLGYGLASACYEQVPGLWEDERLRHNTPELARLMADVRHFVFR